VADLKILNQAPGNGWSRIGERYLTNNRIREPLFETSRSDTESRFTGWSNLKGQAKSEISADHPTQASLHGGQLVIRV
jgi:hypothetical protein